MLDCQAIPTQNHYKLQWLLAWQENHETVQLQDYWSLGSLLLLLMIKTETGGRCWTTHGFFPSSVLRWVSRDSRRLSGACGVMKTEWTNGDKHMIKGWVWSERLTMLIILKSKTQWTTHWSTKTLGSGLFLFFELRDGFFACSGGWWWYISLEKY